MMDFPVAQRLKHLSAMRETWVRSLGQQDPLEKEMATHSSILAWEIPWTEGAWRATVHGVAKSQTRLSDFTFTFKKSCDLQIVHHVAVRIGSMPCSA